jgi:putative ABC transport system ATP-binding protein
VGDLVVRDLTVAYVSGGYTVRPIDGLSFEVPDGNLALLLGPSGCGKTTLLSCLAGILTPASGSIEYAGREIAGLSGAALTAHRRFTVGVVFQAFNLVPSMTAIENVVAPLLAAGIDRREAWDRSRSLLERVDLGERMHHRPGDLSGGQQQRVAIARALVHDPPIILADEPTAHLDYVQVEEVIRLIRELATPGRVVVVSTHDDRMLQLADLVVDLVPAFARPRTQEPKTLDLAPGDEVFREGSRGDLVYVVESGRVDIMREGADGREVHVVSMGPGEYFGEMAPLFNMRRSATARAAEESVVTGYTLDRFREVLGVSGLSDLVRRHDRPTVPTAKPARKATKATKSRKASKRGPTK